MEELIQAIFGLGRIRKGIPQLLYYAPIHPMGAIKLRTLILNYKKINPDSKEVDFILYSAGGSADDAYRIIRTLRNNFETVNIIVPFWAKSAATLLSLGGSAIIMDEWGEFGALDAQLPKQKDDSPYQDEYESALIDEISLETIENRAHQLFIEMFISLHKNEEVHIHKNDIANDIFTYLSKFYEPLLKQINPYKIGDKRRNLEVGEQYANRILLEYNNQVNEEERRVFIDYLVNECPDHGYVVDYALVKKFLPSINVKQSSELDVIYKGYSEQLTKVSDYFLTLDKIETHIGFINEEIIKTEQVPYTPIDVEKSLTVN